MITFAALSNKKIVDQHYDLKILGTRYQMRKVPGFIHMPALGPKESDLKKAKEFEKQQLWSQDLFDTWYAPTFLSFLQTNTVSQKCIEDLVFKSNQGMKILVCCYCKNCDLCHRKVLHELIARHTSSVLY